MTRLRYILTAQRDEYLPLRVIKDRLAAADGDAEADLEGPGAGRPLSRRELLDAAGIDDSYLAELEDFGLVRASGRRYGPDALAAAQIIVALGRYGVQARHLRAVRASVERETALIEQVVAPTLRQRSPGSRDRAGQTAREVAALSLQLHASLMGSALAEAGLEVAGLRPATRLRARAAGRRSRTRPPAGTVGTDLPAQPPPGPVADGVYVG